MVPGRRIGERGLAPRGRPRAGVKELPVIRTRSGAQIERLAEHLRAGAEILQRVSCGRLVTCRGGDLLERPAGARSSQLERRGSVANVYEGPDPPENKGGFVRGRLRALARRCPQGLNIVVVAAAHGLTPGDIGGSGDPPSLMEAGSPGLGAGE